jgi:hypothetical protein
MQSRRVGTLSVLLLSFVTLIILLNGMTASNLAAQEDLEPPNLVSIQMEPAFVDTSQSIQTITVTLHITDDLGGFQSGQVRFARYISTAGNTREPEQLATLAPATLISGTNTNGIYTIQFQLPMFSARGRWYVSTIRLDDKVGNRCMWPRDFPLGDEQCTLSQEIPFVINGIDHGPPPPPTPRPTMTPKATRANTNISGAAATETAINNRIATAVVATLTAIAELTPEATGTPTP